MERRLLLAIVLTFIVLTAYQWVVPSPQPSAPQTKPQSPAASPVQQPSAAPGAAPSAAPQAAVAAPPAPEAVETLRADAAERTITVDNGLVKAVFTNRGATLIAWELANYRGPEGRAVDLIPRDLPPDQPKAFSLRLDDGTKTARINNALFVVASANASSGAHASQLDARTSAVTLSFEYQDVSGLQVRKEFRVEPSSYVVAVTATVTDGGRAINPFIRMGPGLGDVLAASGGGMFVPVRKAEAIFSAQGDVERIQASTLATTARYEGSYEFAGVDTHYFISTAVKPGRTEIEYHPLSLPSSGPDPSLTRDYVGYDIRFPSAAKGPENVRFFLGPKHFETLRAADADLVRAIYFGMFAFLSVPLLSALNWVNGFIGNYGWSIIALTLIINAAMFPLRHKGNVSMRKMQAIQPEVKAIQDRYAKLKVTDPARQKMNTELMELYRQKGVNPASGCVPMLLTFPVLLAFYSLLSEAIELRGAPFIWWIHDLAAADPYYVSPILMGASQLVQQKMMPMTGADPVQQKMMLFMPIMFTFLFITSPAGLAIYWFASNVLVIGQQVLTNRLIGQPVGLGARSK